MSDKKHHKIAILTFQSAYNFGAVLQAYALQEFLSSEYDETRILDYHCEKLDKSYKKPSLIDFVKKPKNSVFRLIQSVVYKKKNNKIDSFRREYFNLTRKYDANSISEANAIADVFVTGSDQVWNYMIIGDDSHFFLDFVEAGNRTCSYAASIGVNEIPQQYVNMYKEGISAINKISVREQQGIAVLNKLGISEAEVLPDPTLLLSKEQWELLSVTPKISDKYILVYKITTEDKMIDFSKMLSKKTGLKIVYIPNDLKAGVIGSTKFSVGPREWLGYIRHAEYVVTNSFHGTVFSIIFGKKFFSEIAASVNPSTSRLLTLLSLFGFQDRTIDRYSDALLTRELPTERIESICNNQRIRAQLFFDSVMNEDD